jgi:hypothetical protein
MKPITLWSFSMATLELVQTMCSGPRLQNSIRMFLQLFNGRPDALRSTLKTMALQISEDREIDNRPRYMTVMVELIKKSP